MAAVGGTADAGRMATRRITAALFGAFVGLWLSRALFKWILDVDGTLLIPLIAAGAAAGAAICVAGEIQSEREWSSHREGRAAGSPNEEITLSDETQDRPDEADETAQKPGEEDTETVGGYPKKAPDSKDGEQSKQSE